MVSFSAAQWQGIGDILQDWSFLSGEGKEQFDSLLNGSVMDIF